MRFGSQPGWEELAAKARAEIRKINRNARLGVLGIEEWEDEAPYSTYEVARWLSEQLRARGEEAPDFPLNAYQLIFRTYSLRHAHGGAGPVLGHIVDAGSSWALRSDRSEGVGVGVDLTWAAMLVGLLAGWIYEEFGLSRSSLDDATAALGTMGAWSYDAIQPAD